MLRNPKLAAALTAVAAGLVLTPAGFAQSRNDPPQTGPATGSGRMGSGMTQGGGMSGTSTGPEDMMKNCGKMMQGQGMQGMSDAMRQQMVERCRSMHQQPSSEQPQPPATAPQQKH